MAYLQWLSGKPVAAPLIAVVGNALKLKVLPASTNERLPLTIELSTPAIAAAAEINNRLAANFTTFSLRALMVGQTMLTIRSQGRVVAGPLVVKVQPVLTLPDASTEAGLLARLLLAEAPNPALILISVMPPPSSFETPRCKLGRHTKGTSSRITTYAARRILCLDLFSCIMRGRIRFRHKAGNMNRSASVSLTSLVGKHAGGSDG